MGLLPHEADEGLERSIEPWTTGDEEAWPRWRESLPPGPAADALMALRAVLSGLAAFRRLEDHVSAETVTDFSARLRVVRAAYGWGLDLVSRLRSDGLESSLGVLEGALVDGLRVTERLLGLPAVDAGVFQSSCDLVLRALPRSGLFRPLNPLELESLDRIVGPEKLPPGLEPWNGAGVRAPTTIAFVTLLRNHRFLGIAEAQIGEPDGLDRAHVVVSAVREELRSLTRFLVAQQVEPLEVREAVDALAMRIDAKVCSSLDDALLSPCPNRRFARPAERLRAGIRDLRATLKDSAKQLRSLGQPPAARPESERVRKNPQQDIWAFRFILRAFIAKASVASGGDEDWSHVSSPDFADEFVRHFRLFGPRLIQQTGYGGGWRLTQAVSALSAREPLDHGTLDLASRECFLFVEHLDAALANLSSSLLAPFDKQQAAADLRDYLSAARDRTAADHAAAGAFGLFDRGRAEAG